MNRTVVLLQMAEMCRLLMRLPCSRKSALFALAPVGFRHSDRWALILLSSGVCPIEAKWNGRKKCCCLRGLESNVIVVIVAPIIKRKSVMAAWSLGTRMIHASSIDLWCAIVEPSGIICGHFPRLFFFFPFSFLLQVSAPSSHSAPSFVWSTWKQKNPGEMLCFFVCLSETLFDMDRKENVGVVVLEPKYGKGRKRMRGGSKKINGKQRYRTTSDRSDCSATADTGKMYSAGEWCLPIFLR